MTSWQNESTLFYSRMAELQHKLKKSEEERLDLEKKFNFMLHSCQAEQEAKIKSLRNIYTKLLEDDRMRCERNDNIMQTLKKVENRASMITAKTDRLRLLRHHYEAYMSRLYPDWKKELGNTNSVIPQIINSDFGNLHTEYKGNVYKLDTLNTTKNNYFNNLPLHTESKEQTTESRPENVPLESYKLSPFDLPHVQISSDNIIQNKLNIPPKPYHVRRKLFDEVPISGTTSNDPLYQHNYNSHYELFTPKKLGEYIAHEQNHTEGNIMQNGKVGDFEMDQNTSDLLSATLSDDGTIKDIPKEAKPYDFNSSNLTHSPFMHTSNRYSEVNNNENKYLKSTFSPIPSTPADIRKPLARTSSFDFPSKSDQENYKYKKSLLIRRPSVLTDNVPSISGVLNKNIRNNSFPKSLINENSAMDNRFKKYLMDTERPYNVKNTYDPRRDVLRYTDKINELMKKEQGDECIRPLSEKSEVDRLQTGRSYDNRSVHFESSPLIEDEKLKDSGNSYNKYMNRFSKQMNPVRNSEPTWCEALKSNDNVKPDKNQVLNSTTLDNNIQDEKNKSIFNFESSNSKPISQKQPTVQNSFSTPSFLFSEYKSPDAKGDKCSILENTETLSHPVRPNKGKLQEISQEECIQFPKEKILEQFPEHTSEQFYRLQAVAEYPQEQADELKTNDETFQSKLLSDYKHNPKKELQNININENFQRTNTEYLTQADHVNENSYSSEKQSGSIGIPRICSDDQVDISKTDNKFYENAIEQLRIETQKSDNLLESSILEQEPNKDETGQNSTMHEVKILGTEHISKTMIQGQNISNNSVMNNSVCNENPLVDNTYGNNSKVFNKIHERPQQNADDQLGFLHNSETDIHNIGNSEYMENAELSTLKQKIKLNEFEKLSLNTGNSDFIDDTITKDISTDLKIMKQLLPTENDIKSGSGGVRKNILSCDDPKEQISSDNIKFNTMDNKDSSEDFSLFNVQNTNIKNLTEETQEIPDYKTSETNEDSIQFNKVNETNPPVNEAATENSKQIIMESHEYSVADNKESAEISTEFKYPIIINNGGDRTENMTTLGNIQEHNKHEGNTDNEQYTQNINNDEYGEHSTNVTNQNQKYPNNKELANNIHDQLDGAEEAALYSNEPNEHEQVFDNVNQQYSDVIQEEINDPKINNDSTVNNQQLDDESKHYENYYPEIIGNQEGNDYIDQQYYTGQQEEYYPNQNVEGTDYANYSNESDDQYKAYAGESNEISQYVSDQYGNEMNDQYDHNDKNEYEQQQENYQGEYRQEHYDNRQQYDQQEGNYMTEQNDNRDQYDQQEGYDVNQYDQEVTYNTGQYEQQGRNYQQNYEESEHYTQQEEDYKNTYHESQYEQRDYQKNYEDENQYEQQEGNFNRSEYEHQEGEYNQSQYNQQEGDYQQNYNESNQFVQQGNYEESYNQYDQYNIPEEPGYTSNMQPSENFQMPGREYVYSEEGNELQDDMADNNYRQDLETDVKATADEQLQPNKDDADMHLKKQHSLAKVLESDSDSVNLGKDQYNDDSSEFDFSSHNEQNNT